MFSSSTPSRLAKQRRAKLISSRSTDRVASLAPRRQVVKTDVWESSSSDSDDDDDGISQASPAIRSIIRSSPDKQDIKPKSHGALRQSPSLLDITGLVVSDDYNGSINGRRLNGQPGQDTELLSSSRSSRPKLLPQSLVSGNKSSSSSASTTASSTNIRLLTPRKTKPDFSASSSEISISVTSSEPREFTADEISSRLCRSQQNGYHERYSSSSSVTRTDLPKTREEGSSTAVFDMETERREWLADVHHSHHQQDCCGHDDTYLLESNDDNKPISVDAEWLENNKSDKIEDLNEDLEYLPPCPADESDKIVTNALEQDENAIILASKSACDVELNRAGDRQVIRQPSTATLQEICSCISRLADTLLLAS
eukprot:TRINITY_DN35233_c0_g3_i1.p1 TRINITY_DN35233_c0_g3~~TRINITY_DN35233_c0_g3_i1.p1  ORF type:complete len:369 (-),score=28.83 TRINITY_DN35233_c0_g3_i1:186-1292(-)